MRLRVRGEGPLVVKVAGLAGGVGLYRREMDAAVAAGFRVAALDTSGDRADDPAIGPLTWEMLSDEVREALDRLDAERAVLWGTSFGCLLSLHAASRFPERIGGLLLCGPPEPGWWLYRRTLGWAVASRSRAAASRALFALAMVLLCGWEGVWPLLWRSLPGLARAAAEAATPFTTYHDKLALLVAQPDLPRAGVPAAIVAGGWDLLAPCRGARRLARRLPGCRLHVVRFAGHGKAWERPATYDRFAVAELRRLTDGAVPRTSASTTRSGW